MAKTKRGKRVSRPARVTSVSAQTEPDSAFVLKISLFLVMGALWVHFITPGNLQIPIPVGALLGIMLARHERFQIDRKIEYVVLLLAAFIGFWLPIGIEILL